MRRHARLIDGEEQRESRFFLVHRNGRWSRELHRHRDFAGGRKKKKGEMEEEEGKEGEVK